MAWDEGLDKNSVAYKIAAAADDRIRVIAGPGTGKSYAMQRRVARLLEEGISPEKVLAVTFTRVAAEDLHMAGATPCGIDPRIRQWIVG